MNKIKVRISTFVVNILENDAMRFGFEKNGKSNKNALLNKLIPILVEVRKSKRETIEKILKNEYNRTDSENIYNAINTVIDRVYFSDEELDVLDDSIWIRPSREARSTFEEIENSEIFITAQEVSVYIRGLLNEYSRLPQYKREVLVFDNELDIFYEAYSTQKILHFTDMKTGEKYRVLAVSYYYGYLYDQNNYCVFFDIPNSTIKALPVNRLGSMYVIKQRYKPSELLKCELQKYIDSQNFNDEVFVEEVQYVF